MEKPMSPGVKKGNGYPREFREEAVRYWLSSGKTANAVADELGISDWSLHRWHKEMEGTPSSTPSDSTELNALELAKENARLRRENEALLRQREILKKAIAIFSAENHSGSSR